MSSVGFRAGSLLRLKPKRETARPAESGEPSTVSVSRKDLLAALGRQKYSAFQRAAFGGGRCRIVSRRSSNSATASNEFKKMGGKSIRKSGTW